MAKLYFRYSAMNAGKTTQLLQVKYNYEARGQNVLLLKPAIDNRDGDDNVKSRIGLECSAIVIDFETDLLVLIKEYLKQSEIHCIIFDEPSF